MSSPLPKVMPEAPADPPQEEALKPPRIRHPTSLHIPEAKNIARAAKGFPWVVVGYRIVLMMMKGEERYSTITKEDGSEVKLVLPNVRGDRGKDKELTTGICIAHGAGEPIPYVGYVSPEHDYWITLGDIVFIEPNSGIIIELEDNEYRVITPHDVVMRAHREEGWQVRKRMLQRARKAILRHHEVAGGELFGAAPNPHRLPERPAYEEEIGDAKERMLREAGQATKSQVSFARKVED